MNDATILPPYLTDACERLRDFDAACERAKEAIRRAQEACRQAARVIAETEKVSP